MRQDFIDECREKIGETNAAEEIIIELESAVSLLERLLKITKHDAYLYEANLCIGDAIVQLHDFIDDRS